MPVTRSRTRLMGKGVGGDATRPYYAEVDSDIDIPEEELAAAFEAEADSSTDELDNLVVTNTAPLVGTPVNRVFKTFTSNTPIIEGLSMIRHLGGDKYEFVNLNDVNIRDISSEEVGEKISHAPQSSNLWKKCKEDWEAITLKVGQAVGSSEKAIFRFENLPLELRCRVYEFAVISPYPLSKGAKTSENLAFGLLRSCRQFHQEAMEYFYKNVFVVNDFSKMIGAIEEPFSKNVRHIQYTWCSFGQKDPLNFKKMDKFKSLETLTLVITSFCTNSMYSRVQTTYQNDDSIKPFRTANGFDSLASLRGLKDVTVLNSKGNYKAAGVKEEDIKAFEKFLKEKLTTPKPLPSGKAKPKKELAAKAKIAARKKKTAKKVLQEDRAYH